MKKKNLKSLKINKKAISNFNYLNGKGGNKTDSCLMGPACPFGPPDDTLDNDCTRIRHC